MRATLKLLLLAAVTAGCTQVDENPKWNPQASFPPWAYDAPFYYRPAEELEPAETLTDGVEVYFTRAEQVFVRHPGGHQVNGVPRMAVWRSTDHGETWAKCGYFGVEQTHFRLQARTDGPQWIRFVGPGQGVSDIPPGMPHRIYVVDRKPPAAVLSVSPGPWEDEEKTVPHVYSPGEPVRLYWGVSDGNLQPETVELGICYAKFPHNALWSRLPGPLPDSGSLDSQIPPEAAAEGGIRYHLRALDKAGNVAVTVTDVLQIAGPAPGQHEAIVPRTGPMDLLAQQTRRIHESWPGPGAMLRGGTSRVLTWMPQEASEYETLELQFSANGGRSWQAVASRIAPPSPVKWMVPHVTSKNCRLRIVAIQPPSEPAMAPVEIVLALSRRFTVDTVVRDMILLPNGNPIRP